MVSHPEPDILECEVKWALGSTAVNKASGCDAIPVEPFKTLNDNTIKVLHFANLEDPAVATGLEKSILIPFSKKGRPKTVQTIG